MSKRSLDLFSHIVFMFLERKEKQDHDCVIFQSLFVSSLLSLLVFLFLKKTGVMAKKRPLSEVEAPIPRDVIAAATEEGPEVKITKSLATSLKDHQIDGIKFMWSHLSKGIGCLLAHSMGLGKSAQAIIIMNLMISLREIKTILLVTPKSTIASWSTEFPLWCANGGYKTPTLFIVGDDTLYARRKKIEDWKAVGGLLIMSYELYGNAVGAYNKGLYNLTNHTNSLRATITITTNR